MRWVSPHLPLLPLPTLPPPLLPILPLSLFTNATHSRTRTHTHAPKSAPPTPSARRWDYKGEPTPYSWPDINSHFGILDIAGFPKDRFYWYQSWFIPNTPSIHAFPHWNWEAGDNYPIWAFSNAAEVELFVNGASAGRVNMTQYGHAEWKGVAFSPGQYEVRGYDAGASTAKISTIVKTAGAPAALRISVKDSMPGPEGLIADCSDVALVQVEVVDSAGVVVPYASDEVTFTVTGPATLGGTGNGDPAW